MVAGGGTGIAPVERTNRARFSLRQLRYFAAAAEALSFTAAARRLHVSQPSISAALAELESSFGVRLFIRHHASGLSLTPAGRDMLERVRSLLKSSDDLHSAARELAGGTSGAIALGCMASLAPLVLPALVSGFVAEHVDVTFRTREAHQEDLLREIRDGSLDLVITYDLELTEGIAFTPLLTLPPYAILPKSHHLAGQRAVSLADLRTEPYVMLDLPHSREYFAALFDVVGSRPLPTFQSAQPEVVRGLVARGLGYSILNFPLKSLRTVDGASFVARPLKEKSRAMTLGLAASRDLPPRRLVQRFAHFCTSEIPGLHGGKARSSLA